MVIERAVEQFLADLAMHAARALHNATHVTVRQNRRALECETMDWRPGL